MKLPFQIFYKGFFPLLIPPLCRSGNEEKLMALLTPLNVNCHASDGRKVSLYIFDFFAVF